MLTWLQIVWALVIVVIIGAVGYWAYTKYGASVYKPMASFYNVGPQKHGFAMQAISDIPKTTAMVAIPGGPGEFLVATKDGKVYYFNRSDPEKTKQLVLDLTKEPIKFTAQHMEQGLMGLALHPENDRVYLSYSTESAPRGPGKMDQVLAEYRLKHTGDDRGARTLQPIREIFRQNYREKYHHGGSLAFGPDQGLYLSTGDGGPQKDPFDMAQDPNSYLGKILRFDVHKYQIGAPQIVASGLRNPYRMSFDKSGQLWIGDVGFDTFESVYKFSVPDVVSGNQPPPNFGWSNYEGSKYLKGDLPFSAFEPPIFEYPNGHDTGHAVIGGEFDHANNLYVFGDWIGRVRSLQSNGKRWEQVSEQKLPGDDMLFSFAKDQNTGDIYALGEKKIYSVQVTTK